MSLFAVLDPAVRLAHDAVSALAQAVPTALAVVLFTVAVRLALHPLARAAARGEKARLRLAPRVAELQRTHKGRPEKLRAALAELYRAERTSPLAGILPMLVQIPFFSVMYRLFTTPNDLLGHTLAGVPLGLHVGDAHGPAQLVVFAGLYAALAAVGYAGFRRARRAAAGGSPAPSAGSAPAGAPVRVPGARCCRTCRSARCCSRHSSRSRRASTCSPPPPGRRPSGPGCTGRRRAAPPRCGRSPRPPDHRRLTPAA
ncbi:hypothetical protein GCM10025734_33910 [Kitasatospora paranensis]|uniref:YidC/Oxa1 family membrane protein insertase n=1 Tax=Kitasatospora paranensis TaxID=258053 RepID=UPI0031E74EC7